MSRHGTRSRFIAGCRCDQCRVANRVYLREHRRRYVLDPQIAFKQEARNQLNRAVRLGTVLRQPCETCGAEPAEAHHADYEKPLEVQWLCAGHHRLLHSLERVAA